MVGKVSMTTFSWKSGINADWNTPAGWDTGIVPNSGAADVVIATSANTVTIGAAESFLTKTMTLSAGTLQLQNSGTLITNGVFIGGDASGPGTNRGTLNVAGSLFDSGVFDIWAGSTLLVTGGVDLGTSGVIPGTVLIEAGHSLTGDGLISGSVLNNSTIQVSAARFNGTPGTFEVAGALTGTGIVNLAPSSILKLDGAIASSQAFVFGAGGAEALILNDIAPGTIRNSFSGLNIGDRIEFGGVTAITNAQMSGNGGTVTVTTNVGTYVLNSLTFAAGANRAFFSFPDRNTDL
jgi:hypothetical protein